MKRIETKSVVLLKHHLKALKMPTMHSECEKIAARCAKENVDHLGFLLQLCEMELLDRERRAAQRGLKAARFPTYKTLENFDFTAQPSINRLLVTELMRCAYIDKWECVLLVGNSGTGKTHVATALAVEACGRGKRVRLWRVPCLPGWRRNERGRKRAAGSLADGRENHRSRSRRNQGQEGPARL